jgi:hypothetical protein
LAGNIEAKYGTNGQAITITLNSLAASATVGRASASVDNTANVFLDALVGIEITLAAGTPSSSKAIWVYAYGTANGGTDYTDGCTGSDAGFTRTDPPNLPLLGILNAPTAGGLNWLGGPWSVAQAFGGNLPDHWGIAVFDDTGVALASSDNSAWYQGVYGQYT